MDLAVAGCISAYDVTFGVDSVCFGKRGSGNVNRLEVAPAQQKSMHVGLLGWSRRAIEVVPDDVSARVNAGDPGGATSWEIDGLEVAAAQQKAVYATSILEITDDAAVANHGGPRLRSTREIDPGEIAMTQKIAMSNSTDKCLSDDLAGRTDPPTCSNLSTGVLERSKCVPAQDVGSNESLSGQESIGADDLATRIDPPDVTKVSGTGEIYRSELVFPQNKAVHKSYVAFACSDISSYNLPAGSNTNTLGSASAWEIK